MEFGADRLFLGRGLGDGVAGAGEDGVISAAAGEHYREADRGNHEDDCRPCGEFCEKRGCATRAEGGLGTLAAEGSG